MLIADWDVIVTIFNFTILAISAIWRKSKQEQSAIIKIAMFGPESTGKTTLAIQPDHYKTVWFLTQGLFIRENGMKSSKFAILMIWPIAYGQTKLENHNQLLISICFMTNLMVTKVSEYYNYCDPALDKAAQNMNMICFFTDIDVPWEKMI
jgi:nicotinamide riboside kinase